MSPANDLADLMEAITGADESGVCSKCEAKDVQTLGLSGVDYCAPCFERLMTSDSGQRIQRQFVGFMEADE